MKYWAIVFKTKHKKEKGISFVFDESRPGMVSIYSDETTAIAKHTRWRTARPDAGYTLVEFEVPSL